MIAPVARASEASLESQGAKGLVADRLIAQVNAQSYSQWQVESYFLVKESLRGAMAPAGEGGEVRFAPSAQWKGEVEAFVTEMLVFQEAERIGSFVPTSRMVEQALALVDNMRGREPAIHEAWTRLGLTQALASRVVAQVLRVDAFSQSQERVLPTASANGGKDLPLAHRPWVQALRDRALVRFFDGAEIWREVRWPAGGAS
jgi:hypothetical protein